MNKFLFGVPDGIWLAVIGSRDFTDKEVLFEKLDKNESRIALVVSGGARGADTLAKEWAESRGKPLLTFYAKWKGKDGSTDKGAGFRRNRWVMENADYVLAMWDEVSSGTANAINIAKQLNKKVHVYNFKTKKQSVI